MFDSENADLTAWLNRLFASLPVAEAQGPCAVAECLVGTKKTRLGARPCQEHFEYLNDLCGRYVALRQPIDVMTMWGGQKGYGLFDDHNVADLVDLLALRRLAGIAADVRRFHEPGIRVRIVWEDATEFLMARTGFLATGCCSGTYRERLQELIDALGLSEVVCISAETTLLAAHGVDLCAYTRRVHRNASLMWAYRKACDRADWRDTEKTEEYAALLDAGWRGVIPPEQWAWYERRACSESPDLSDEERLQSICLYFGIALGRAQVRTLRANVEDQQGPVPPVKLSFVPYPPGANHALSRGRVEVKLKDSKNSHKTIAPWAGFGLFSQGDCELLGVQQMRERRASCQVVSATLHDRAEARVLVSA